MSLTVWQAEAMLRGLSPLRCACGNWLGVLHPDGRVEVRHRGRSLIGRLDEIVCEKDGRIWRFAPSPETIAKPGLSTAG